MAVLPQLMDQRQTIEPRSTHHEYTHAANLRSRGTSSNTPASGPLRSIGVIHSAHHVIDQRHWSSRIAPVKLCDSEGVPARRTAVRRAAARVRTLRVRWLGRVSYAEADDLQRALHARADNDYLLL